MRALAPGWLKADNSRATAGGISTLSYHCFSRSSRPMMARLETGEVLLTARMSNIFLRFRQTVLPRDAAFAQLHAKGVMIQARQACGLRQR